MFEGQPKGLYALALANTGERFGYYTMIAVFALFLRANFGLDAGWAGEIYGDFLMLVYFLPILGGIMADKFGFGKMVTIGIVIMFLGYLLLSIPLGGKAVGLVAMLIALVLVSFGTGLFKGNLQVMVGNLYDDPKYADKRDAGFSIFYMAINIGALFAPTAAIKISEWAKNSLGYTAPGEAYHFAFAVACASLILSIAIYYAFRGTFRHTEGGKKNGADKAAGSVIVKFDNGEIRVATPIAAPFTEAQNTAIALADKVVTGADAVEDEALKAFFAENAGSLAAGVINMGGEAVDGSVTLAVDATGFEKVMFTAPGNAENLGFVLLNG